MTAPDSRRPAWLDDFTIPVSAAGVVLAFDFGDDGLWAARIDRRLDVEETVVEPRITPAVLDVRTASYLRDSETVAGADRPEVFAELTDVCRRARDKLIERDSVLLMGTEHLRLVTVSLDTAMAATMPEVNRAHGMIVELAGREPVAAVFLGPGTDAWPGLWESLTARGFAMLLPDDTFPETFAGDDDETDVLESVDEAPTSLAWAAEAHEPPAGLTTVSPPRRRDRHRRQVMGTAAALAVVALAGTAVAVTVVNDDDDPGTDLLATLGTSDPTGVEPTPAASPSTVAPDDLRAARAQMERYTPPTTSSSSATSSTTEARPGTGPRPRPRPNTRRTLPNPIPGLPPIVIG